MTWTARFELFKLHFLELSFKQIITCLRETHSFFGSILLKTEFIIKTAVVSKIYLECELFSYTVILFGINLLVNFNFFVEFGSDAKQFFSSLGQRTSSLKRCRKRGR